MVTNAFYNVIYQIATLLMPILTTPYVSRILGPEGVGQYVLGDTYSQYFILIGSLGLSLYSAREIAYVRDNNIKLKQTFWELVSIRSVSIGCAVLCYYIIFFLMGFKNSIVNQIFIINIISAVFDVSWFFIGIEDFKNRAIKSVVIKVLAVLLIFILVKNSKQVWLYTLIICCANFIGQLIMWPDIPSILFEKKVIKGNLLCISLKKHFKGALSIFASMIIIQVYILLDRLMLGEMVGNSPVAYYENSQKIIRGIATLLTASIQALSPRMASYYINNENEQFIQNNYSIFRIVSMIAFPLCFGLMGIANTFSVWYYGAKFDGIEILLLVGAPTIISLAWTGAFSNNILIATGKQKVLTIAVLNGAVADIILNIIFIKKYTALATTVSTLVAEVLGLIIMIMGVRRILPIKYFFHGIWKYFLCSLCMGVVVYELGDILPNTPISTVLQIICGGSIYFLGLIIFREKILIEIIYKIKNMFTKR